MAIINGTVNNDTLFGTAAADSMFGLAGNDRLNGGAGDDVIDGGLGNDTMIGGLGNDIYIVDSASDVITEAANQGIDTVRSSLAIDLRLYANVENAVLLGSGALNLVGNTLANNMTGNAANNVLNGAAGADRLTGGLGNDTYVVDVAGDVIVEAAAAGTDTVQATFSYTLGANVENLLLLGALNLNGTGNTLNNTITGNNGANFLSGGVGNDILIGGLGDDSLQGGAGSDSMRGGAGDDEYGIESVGDTVVELASEGDDSVFINFAADPGEGYTFIMSANLENAFLAEYDETDPEAPLGYDINVNGNAADNFIEGNAGDNILIGYGGNDELRGGFGRDLLIGGAGDDVLNGNQEPDIMIGGIGNDEYFVGSLTDVIVEYSGQGNDQVYINPRNPPAPGFNYVLSANIEDVAILDREEDLFYDMSATGNSLGNSMEGNSGQNTLSGEDGDDMLDGGFGNDLLIGGDDDDFFRFSSALDAVDNVDTIDDFGGGDSIELLVDIFSQLGVGVVAAANFIVGTVAADADDYLIYDDNTGELYYDADGNGAEGQILFALVDGAPGLTAADFSVID